MTANPREPQAACADVPCPHPSTWRELVALALAEDLGAVDWTSHVSIAPDARGAARIEAREPLTVCGLAVAAHVFAEVDAAVDFQPLARDGERAEAGQRLARIEGPTRSLLAAERTALNFLGRLCGIATGTARYVDAVRGTRAAIVDTRKTLPGWRVLDKYAVAVGGGVNHRMGLFDGILLKDNHAAAAGGVGAAAKAALARAPSHIRVQVEVESLADARAAVEAGADFLLLDNQSPEATREIVDALGDRATLESSGSIELESVRAYAETGVHRISVGALTHSVRRADLALEMEA